MNFVFPFYADLENEIYIIYDHTQRSKNFWVSKVSIYLQLIVLFFVAATIVWLKLGHALDRSDQLFGSN